jgi:hypothetical protein
MQAAARARFAKRLKSTLCGTVYNVIRDQDPPIEENFLGLALADGMLVPALAAVAIVPIESDDAREVDHRGIL